MPKAKSGKASAEKAPTTTETAPASSKDELVGMDQKARAAERAARAAAAEAQAKRQAVEEARRRFEAEQRKKNSESLRYQARNATVWVVAQTKKEKPIKLPGGFLDSRVPVKVARNDLRKLQGLQRKGAIQLVVGELEKPGELRPRPEKPEPKPKATSKEG